MTCILNGRISFRSSKTNQGPPGERFVLEMNPQRRAKILELTGWARLEAGTLNVDVDLEPFDRLLRETAAWIEPGESVVYPQAYRHIPLQRKAYLYYRGVLDFNTESREVLVRRAECPGPIRIEVYAPENLKTSLELKESDEIRVTIG